MRDTVGMDKQREIGFVDFAADVDCHIAFVGRLHDLDGTQVASSCADVACWRSDIVDERKVCKFGAVDDAHAQIRLGHPVVDSNPEIGEICVRS